MLRLMLEDRTCARRAAVRVHQPTIGSPRAAVTPAPSHAALLPLLQLAGAIRWNTDCLCELKESPVVSEFSLPAIFGTALFRQHGRVAQFCPCSVETVQQLNRDLISLERAEADLGVATAEQLAASATVKKIFVNGLVALGWDAERSVCR